MAENNDRGLEAIGEGERTSQPSETSFPSARPISEVMSKGLATTANDPLPIDGNVTPTENEYDTLAQVSAPDPNPYVNLIRQGQEVQKQQLQQSMYAAKDQDPDRTAKVLQLSDQLRLPVPIVERNYDKLSQDKSLAATDYDTLIQKTPGLATWLKDPTNAALGKDDLENLGKIDQANSFFKPIKEFGSDIGTALHQGTVQTYSSVLALAPLAQAYGLISPETAATLAEKVADQNKSEADLAAKAPPYLAEYQRLREEHGDRGSAWTQFVKSFPEIQNGQILQALKDFGSGSLKTVGNTLSLVKDLATNPRASIYQLAEMTPFGLSMAPGASAGALAGAPLGPIGASVGAAIGSFANSAPLLVGGKINDLLKQKGVDISNADSLRTAYQNPEVMSDVLAQAKRSGLTMAVVQSLFMPLAGKFLSKAGPSVASQVLGAGADLGIQSGGLAVSDLASQVAENKGDLSKVDPMQSLSNGLLGLAHSVGSEVVGHSFRSRFPTDTVQAAKDVSAKTDEALQTVQNAQALTEMGHALTDSKVGERAPAKIAEMLDGAGHDHQVYFQPEDWDQYWKTKGISPVEAAQEVMGSSAPYFEAKQTGANLEIPMSDFASKLGKTEHFDNLIPESRSEPDGMKLSEANEHLESLPATMEELAKEAQAGTPEEQSAKAIKDEVKAQLVESGTLPADAEKQSSLYESAFKSLGERTGQDPKELFDQYKLKISKTDLERLASEQDKVFNQADLEKQNDFRKYLRTPDSEKDYAKIPETMDGKYINQDLARKLLPEYAASREGVIKHLETTQKPSADFTQKLFDKALLKPVLGDASFIIGGPGSGKTTAGQKTLEGLSKVSDLVLDGVGANADRLSKNIEAALKSGREANVVFVYSSFDKALENIVERYRREGRSVPLDIAAKGHVEALESYLKLEDKYQGDERVHIQAVEPDFEKSQGFPEPRSVDEIKKLRYIGQDESPEVAIERLQKIGENRLAQTDAGVEGGLGQDAAEALASPKDGRTLFQNESGSQTASSHPSLSSLAEPFYLKSEKLISEKMGNSATPEQVNGILKELKPEERQWLGVDEFLKGKEKINKQELLEYLKANQLEIKEVTKGAGTLTDRINKLNYEASDTSLPPEKRQALLKEHDSLLEEYENTSYKNGINENPKFSKYTLPGGENYREMLFTLPPDQGKYKLRQNPDNQKWEIFQPETGKVIESYNPGDKADAERAVKWQTKYKEGNYVSSHFDEPNIFAHTRVNDRVDSKGNKILFMEEVQSDWHQEGRKKGYKGDVESIDNLPDGYTVEPTAGSETQWYAKKPNGEIIASGFNKEGATNAAINELNRKADSTVPDAPFKKTWHEFVLKRMIREAAEKGYDKIAWTTGEQQAERYDLSKQVDKIVAIKEGDSFTLMAHDDHGSHEIASDVSKEKLESHVGKDLAAKIIADSEASKRKKNFHYSGLDLKVGGEGMKGFYDKILVDAANKLGKKYGARVENSNIPSETEYQSELKVDHNEDTGNWLVIDRSGEMATDQTFESKEEAQDFIDSNPYEKTDVKVHSLELTPALKETALKDGFSLFQNGSDGPRGQIRIGADKTFSIDLLKNANMSTFLHETGHFYLEVLSDVANSDKATDQIKGDLGTIREWLGAKEGEAFTTEQHEQFARGFETYLMEGKAPSTKLQKAFSAFKVWLANIYRQAKNLKADLTPEVRQVFDRLLASEDEIRATELKQNMHPLFDEPAKYGMNEKQAARYIAARDEARNASEDELSNKLLDDVRKKTTTAYKEKLKAAREEAGNQVDEQNLYKAINQLQGHEVRLDMPEMKLDRQTVIDQYGKEFIQKLPRGIFAKAGEEGLHPDMAAELFQFHSADDMLTQMANAPNRAEAVEALAQQKIQERSPDLLQSGALDEAAMKAVHNTPREKLLRMELEHLAQNNLPVLKDVIRKIARRVPTEKQVRDQAEQIISGKKLEDAKPYLFERAEAKAAKEAGELLAKGDIDGAFEAKQKELLNHELYKAASAAEEDIDKSLDRFKKLSRSDEDLSKTRDTDLVNSARSLLSKYGVGSFADESPDSFLKKIKNYDEETYYTLQALMEPLSQNAKPYDQLTYGEFTQLKETIDALWSLARSQKQILVDGLRISRDDAILKLSSRLFEVTESSGKAPYEKAKTGWDKTKMILLGAKAALTRVEHWSAALDKGSIDGPFQTHLFRPVEDGINQYRLRKEEAMKQVIEILEPLKNDLTRKTPIRSDELGYEFSGKSELLGALLHTGNESNFDKLLRGNGWEKEKWDAFIKRMHENGTLKKGDYDLIQNVWKFFELLKPDAQKAHKEMYGFHFNEITSKPFDTPFGRYEGGYAPAIADPLKAPDASIRSERESLEKFNNSWMFPTTGRGFTKGRVETYAAPLQMDLRLVPGHVDKVLRFTNIEPRVKDVSKIVLNKEFRKTLDAFDPTVGADLLTPWLQRAAQQKISTPTQGWAGRGSDIFFGELRNRTGLNSLVGNLGHIFHMFTGLPTAAVLVDMPKMRDALWTYVKSPKEMSSAMTEKSDFMKVRSAHQTSQLMETIEELISDPSKYQQVKAASTKYGYFIQQMLMNQIDMVTWHGAYNQAIEEGHPENLAVAQADSVVRRTQHASNPEDVSRFETGTPFVRFFTQFVSYFNMRANLLGSEGSRIYRDFGLKKGAGQFLYLYTLGHLVPALLHEAITRGIAGNFKKDDDDSTLGEAMSFFFGSQARETASLLPIVGPVGTAIYNRVQGKGYDDRITTSPAMSSIESAASVPHDFLTLMRQGTHGKAAIHDSLTLLGLLTGLPLAPLSRPLGYLSDVNEGKATPSGPIDFTRGILTGKPGK